MPKLRLNRTWSVPVDHADQLFPVCRSSPSFLCDALSCMSQLILPLFPAASLTAYVMGVEHRRLRMRAIAVGTGVTGSL
jgi:hypothetical protein